LPCALGEGSVVVHPDDNNRGVRCRPRDKRQPSEAARPEHRLVKHHGIRCDATQENDQIGEVRGRCRRLNVPLALEEAPERGPDPVIPRGDEHRNRRMDLDRLDGHGARIDGTPPDLIRARG
jgi:hypothetical protein